MEIIKNYWPLFALGLWFGYKWWNTKKIKAMLPELKNKGALLVDVRAPYEFAHHHAPGTINIPLQELSSRLNELPKDKPLVLCCASGTRSGMARRLLLSKGYKNVFNIGSWRSLNS